MAAGSKKSGYTCAAVAFPMGLIFLSTIAAAIRAVITQANYRSDRAVGESSSTSGCSLVNSASFVVTSLCRTNSPTAAASR